jgi:2'-5' RNA ligase
MPLPGDEATLQRIVEDLAGRFAGPLFRPHLTLMEEQEHEVADLASACRTVAAGTEQFSAPIQDVGTSDHYFRSLYARFQAEGTLLDLRRGVVKALSIEAAGSFMPHISLFYGGAPDVEKEQARAALGLDLAGALICFDRICVVASAKTIPVADWAVKFTAMLRPVPERHHTSGRFASGNTQDRT